MKTKFDEKGFIIEDGAYYDADAAASKPVAPMDIATAALSDLKRDQELGRGIYAAPQEPQLGPWCARYWIESADRVAAYAREVASKGRNCGKTKETEWIYGRGARAEPSTVEITEYKRHYAKD